MSDTDAPRYYCLLTDAGAALEARAHAQRTTVRLRSIAVGDGGGAVPTPAASATALIREVHRRPIDALEQDKNDPHVAWLHVTFPADVGGWWIREFGVYADNPDDPERPVLYAYGSHSPYYKMLSAEGQATTHELSVPVVMSSSGLLEIVISEAGYATRLEYLYLSGIVEALRGRRRAVWTTSAAVAENGILNLPDGLTYLPGRRAVSLSWDGLTCHLGQQFEEVGEPDRPSSSLRLLFAAPAGSEFQADIAGHCAEPPLPSITADPPDAALDARVSALENNLTQIARGAAYVTPPANNPLPQE